MAVFRLAVTGTANFSDYEKAAKIMNNFRKYFGEFEYVDRGLSGVDELGRKYAKENNIETVKCIAEDENPSNIDVDILNTRLVDNLMKSGYVPYLIVFWDERDSVTEKLMDLAKSKNRRLWLIVYDYNLGCIFSNCTD